MAIFNKNDGGIMDVIRCDEQDYLVWKWHPKAATTQTSQRANAIRWGSSLRVRDGSSAILVYPQAEGEPDYITGPYDKIIETKNFPVLASLVGTLYQGDSPFQAEVYFVNTANTVQIPFGVGPVDAFDPHYRSLGIPVAVRGAINFRISDVHQFVACHSLNSFSTEDFKAKIRAFVSEQVKGIVPRASEKLGIPLVQIESELPQIAKLISNGLREELYNLHGVELSTVNISAIEFDKNSSGFKKLEKQSQGKGIMFAQGVVSAFGEIKTSIAGEKILSGAGKPDASGPAQKASSVIGNLFGKKTKVTPPPIPTVTYFVAVNGKQKGPYDITKLRKMMSEGDFSEETLVWKEGMENWMQASSVDALKGLFQSMTSTISDTDIE